MSEEIVRPQDVLAGGLRQKLIDAMIHAYMAKGAIEDGSLQGVAWRKEESGEWRYVVELVAAGDPDIVCDSSGRWRHAKPLAPDKTLSVGLNHIDGNDNAYAVTVFDARAKWAEIEDFVDAWTRPWVLHSPNPNAFTNQINSVATVARQLYVGNAPQSAGQGIPPASADEDLWDAMTQLMISIDDTSRAVDLFQNNYATDIWKTVGGQQSLVYAAGLAITTEASAWNATYASLRDFLTLAAHDFKAFGNSAEGRGSELSAFLGATSAVTSLLGATAGMAFPPFGAAMGAVSSATNVAQIMNPEIPAINDDSLTLTGGSYEAKTKSFKEQIKRIEKDLAAAERGIAAGCRAALKDLRTSPDNYSLRRSPSRQGDFENFPAMYASRIDIHPQKLRRSAAACELIANHQRGLAKILSGRDAAGNPSSVSASEWSRGALPEGGTIGSTSTGPLASYENVIDAAVTLLLDESKESHRVPTGCCRW